MARGNLGKAKHLRRLFSTNSTGKGSSTVGHSPGPVKPGQNPSPVRPGQEPLKKSSAPSNRPAEGTPTKGKAASPLGGPHSPPGAAIPPNTNAKQRDNRWRFSESFPVDVRILAGGTLAFAGFLTYSYNKKVNQAQSNLDSVQQTSHGSGKVFDNADSGTPLAGDDATAAQDQTSFYTDELAQDSAQEGNTSDASSLESPREAPAADESSPQEPQDAGLLPDNDLEALRKAQEADDPQAREVAEILNEVLSSGVPAGFPDSQQLEDILNTPVEQGDSNEEHAQSLASKVKEEGRSALHHIEEALEAVTGGVAGDSAEAMISAVSHVTHSSKKQPSKSKEDIDDASVASTSTNANEDAKEPSAAASQGLSSDHTQLGVDDDLRPAALVRKAIDRGEGGDNWQDYRARLLQAEADSRTFQNHLERLRLAQDEKDASGDAQAARLESRIIELQKKLRDNALLYKQALEEQFQMLEAVKSQELKRQEDYLSIAYAEAAIRERAIRSGQLDEIRSKLNSLTQAFDHRSTESKNSHMVHKLSVGTLGLSAALQQGTPFREIASSLRESCSDDSVVSSVLDSLPDSLANQGVETQSQLLTRWPEVRSSISQLSMLSPGNTTFIGLGLASLASRLKVKEHPEPGSAPANVEQTLALAEDKLVSGHTLQAASLIQQAVKGTAAETAAKEFAEDLRARATADQAVQLLEAHASSHATSLS